MEAPPDVGALLDAAQAGDINRVRELGEGGVGVNDADDQGFTALHCASQEGHVAIVDILLEAGATVDQAKGERRHPTLHRLPDRQAGSRRQAVADVAQNNTCDGDKRVPGAHTGNRQWKSV